VRGYTKSAPGVRHICRGMNVRDLNRRAENQQQGTAKSKSGLPRVARVIFCLLIVHHSNYNPAYIPEGERGLCGVKMSAFGSTAS
jgi:hypothetical protein